MSNAQAERAINQLYESDSLRSELRDEEASLLLSWGEIRLGELAKHDLPNSQFDQLSENFRRLMAAINVCVGKRKTSPSQHLPMMTSISSAAESAGYAFSLDDQTTFLKHQSALTNQDAISELLGLLKPMEISQPAEIPQPPSEPVGESTPEIITPQAAPEVVDNTQLPQPEELPEQPQFPPEPVGESTPEIITPQAAPEVVDHTQPPQPEELPEQPQQPPQEGSHDD